MRIGLVKSILALYPPSHSVLLLGPPGVGKSRTIWEFAEEEALRLGREFVDYDDDDELYLKVVKSPERYYVFLDFRLSECEPSDFLGVPRDTDHYIVYKPLRWVHVFALPKIAGMLFLDELTNIRREDVLAQAYKLVLDRKAGYKKFSENVRIIAAGNDPEHSAIANLLPAPLLNRFSVLKIDAPTVEEWISYVDEHEGGVDVRIAGYLLRFRDDLIHVSDAATLQQYPTPRSWSKLNEIIRAKHDLDENVPHELATSYVGPSVAAKFIAFCKIGAKLPTPERLLEKPELLDEIVDEKNELDVLYYAVVSVMSYVNEKTVKVDHAVKFMKYMTNKKKEMFAVMVNLLKKELRTEYLMSPLVVRDQTFQDLAVLINKYLR